MLDIAALNGREKMVVNHFHTTWFQLILQVLNLNVTKNLTGYRMHLAGPQINQMNHQTISFQNMCDMLKTKIDLLATKIYFVQKNTSKSAILVDTNLG